MKQICLSSKPDSGFPPSRGFWRLLLLCAATTLAVLLIGRIARQLLYDCSSLLHSYIINPMEGREAVKAWMLGNGYSLYPQIPGPSPIVTIYPPLYHLLTLVMAQANGDFLQSGRLLSLLSTAVVAALIVAWTRNATRNNLIAAITGLSFLADPFSAWGAQARPDMLAHALALGSAYVFLKAQRGRGAVFAAMLAALALFTKQQTLPFILGTMVFGLSKGAKERRLLIRYVSALAVFTIIPFIFLNYETNGQFFIDVVAYPKHMGETPGIFSTDNLLGRLRVLWGVTAWKTALMGCWILIVCFSLRFDFALILILANLPFALPILGTWGADYNYALGIVILMYPCLGMLAGKLTRFSNPGPVLAALLFILVNLDGGFTFSQKAFADPHKDKWSGVREEIVTRLNSGEGLILANTEGGQLLLGQNLDSRVTFFDAIELELYEKAGFWSFMNSGLARDIASRKYKYILLSNTFIPQNMKWLMASYYIPPVVMGQYALYTPRSEDIIAPVSSLDFPLSTEGTTVQLLDKENLKFSKDHIEPADPGLPARLTLEVAAQSRIKEMILGLYPRLNNADGSSLSITVVSAEDGLSHTWTCPKLPGDEWSGEWDVHSQERFEVAGNKIRITFNLKGNAQLFFDKPRPMTICLSVEK